jgi:hypothetical protein
MCPTSTFAAFEQINPRSVALIRKLLNPDVTRRPTVYDALSLVSAPVHLLTCKLKVKFPKYSRFPIMKKLTDLLIELGVPGDRLDPHGISFGCTSMHFIIRPIAPTSRLSTTTERSTEDIIEDLLNQINSRNFRSNHPLARYLVSLTPFTIDDYTNPVIHDDNEPSLESLSNVDDSSILESKSITSITTPTIPPPLTSESAATTSSLSSSSTAAMTTTVSPPIKGYSIRRELAESHLVPPSTSIITETTKIESPKRSLSIQTKEPNRYILNCFHRSLSRPNNPDNLQIYWIYQNIILHTFYLTRLIIFVWFFFFFFIREFKGSLPTGYSSPLYIGDSRWRVQRKRQRKDDGDEDKQPETKDGDDEYLSIHVFEVLSLPHACFFHSSYS